MGAGQHKNRESFCSSFRKIKAELHHPPMLAEIWTYPAEELVETIR